MSMLITKSTEDLKERLESVVNEIGALEHEQKQIETELFYRKQPECRPKELNIDEKKFKSKRCDCCNGKGEVQQTDIDWDPCGVCHGTGILIIKLETNNTFTLPESQLLQFSEAMVQVSIGGDYCYPITLDLSRHECFIVENEKYTFTIQRKIYEPGQPYRVGKVTDLDNKDVTAQFADSEVEIKPIN